MAYLQVLISATVCLPFQQYLDLLKTYGYIETI